MSNSYLLSCDCGKSIAIETSQAGQQLTCSCGRRLTVPTLRAIRQLPPATAPVVARSGASQRATWNPLKGALFAGGVVLVLIGLAVTAHSYNIYSQVAAFQPSTMEYDSSLEMIDNMSPVDLWETWHFVKQHGLDPAGSSPFALAKTVAAEKQKMMVFGSLLAAVGLLVAVVPLFFRGR